MAKTIETIRAQAHPRCVVCSTANPLGLGVTFETAKDGSVQGTFSGGTMYEGYAGRMHGGLIAALLDGAMTNCLFARGQRGMTASLTVRYREAVTVPAQLTVRAWLERSRPPLHCLRAELRQDGRLKATATAKLMEQRD